jgi:hypothetical protein
MSKLEEATVAMPYAKPTDVALKIFLNIESKNAPKIVHCRYWI